MKPHATVLDNEKRAKTGKNGERVHFQGQERYAHLPTPRDRELDPQVKVVLMANSLLLVSPQTLRPLNTLPRRQARNLT